MENKSSNLLKSLSNFLSIYYYSSIYIIQKFMNRPILDKEDLRAIEAYKSGGVRCVDDSMRDVARSVLMEVLK